MARRVKRRRSRGGLVDALVDGLVLGTVAARVRRAARRERRLADLLIEPAVIDAEYADDKEHDAILRADHAEAAAELRRGREALFWLVEVSQ